MVSADELALPAEWFEDGIMQLEADDAAGRGRRRVVRPQRRRARRRSDEQPRRRDVGDRARARTRRIVRRAAATPVVRESRNRRRSARRRAVTHRIAGLHCVSSRSASTASRVAPAPAWMRIRLALAGQRPINNLVDISNYVMLETAQPLHFYDEAQVADRHFVVRDAREGETLTTLDGVERTLRSASDSVIADDEPARLGLAGLMGGADSEVRDSTRAIMLEAANFTGSRVRRMSAATRAAQRSVVASREDAGTDPGRRRRRARGAIDGCARRHTPTRRRRLAKRPPRTRSRSRCAARRHAICSASIFRSRRSRGIYSCSAAKSTIERRR